MKKKINYEIKQGQLECQNCGTPLAQREKNETRFLYSEQGKNEIKRVKMFCQALTEDETLITLICPNCDCFSQIKTF